MCAINKRHSKYPDSMRLKAILLILIVAVFSGFFSILSRSMYTSYSIFSRYAHTQSSIKPGIAWHVPLTCPGSSRHGFGILGASRLLMQGLLIPLNDYLLTVSIPRAPPLSFFKQLNNKIFNNKFNGVLKWHVSKDRSSEH